MTRLWQKSTAFRPCKLVLRKWTPVSMRKHFLWKTLTFHFICKVFFSLTSRPTDRPVNLTPIKCEKLSICQVATWWRDSNSQPLNHESLPAPIRQTRIPNHLSMELFSIWRWRLKSAQVVRCLVYEIPKSWRQLMKVNKYICLTLWQIWAFMSVY